MATLASYQAVLAVFKFGKDVDKSLSFDCDVAWRYLFNRSEMRSFDLYDRQWSRYMPVFATQAAAAADTVTPGINTFTQKMKVQPGLQFDVNWGFVL